MKRRTEHIHTHHENEGKGASRGSLPPTNLFLASTNGRTVAAALRMAAIISFISLMCTASAASLTATPSKFTLTNTTIDVGQIAIANTVISGGSGGPYSGAWTWINQNLSTNKLDNQVVNSINVGSYPQYVAFNPSGALAFVTNYNSNTVSTINVASNSVVNTIAVGPAPWSISVNPKNTLAYVVNQNSGAVNVISLSTNAVIKTILVGPTPYGISFNPFGGLAYVTDYGGTGAVNVINVATNSIASTISVGSSPTDAVFNPNGSIAYVTNSGSGTVSVIKVATNTVINTITVGTNPISVAFNPTGSMAYIVNYGSGTVNVINVASNTVINTITEGTHPTYVSFNPSGSLAYVVNTGAGSTVNVINVAANSVINTIVVNSNPWDIAISPTGTLAYVTEQNTNQATAIGNLSGTSVQELSGIQTSNGLMRLTINAISSNSLSFTFNGVKYSEAAASSIYGALNLYAVAQDNGTNPYYYGSNALLLANTLTIDSALNAPSISPSNPGIDSGQSVTFSSSWGSSAGTLAIDGVTNSIFTGGSSGTMSITTSNTNDVLVVYAGAEGASSFSVNSVSDTAGLTWTKRNANVITSDAAAYYDDQEVWYAVSPNKLSSDTITVKLSAGIDDAVIQAFAVSGTNTVTPWDSSITLPANAIHKGTASAPPNITVSTSQYPDFIFGFAGSDSIGSGHGSANGYISDNGAYMTLSSKGNYGGTNAWNSGIAFNSFSTAQTSSMIQMNITNEPLAADWYWMMMGDALHQSATLNSGTPPYTAKLYSSSTSTCNSGSTLVQTISGLAAANAIFSAVSPTSNTWYCVFITDSASTPVTTNSINSEVTVNPALATPTIAGTNSPTVDANQYISFSAYESAGTSPFTYKFYVYNSVTGTQLASTTTSSNTFLWQVPAADAGNTVNANVFVTDSSYGTAQTANSILTSTWTVNPALSTPTLTVSNTPYVDAGQYESFAASWSGGTSSYTANYQVVNSVTGTLVANALYSGLSGTTNTFLWQVPAADAGNTITAKVYITDSVNGVVNSIASKAVTINPQLSVVIGSPSNSILDVGQYQSFTATTSGGTLVGVYNAVYCNSGPVSGTSTSCSVTASTSPGVFCWGAGYGSNPLSTPSYPLFNNAGGTGTANVAEISQPWTSGSTCTTSISASQYIEAGGLSVSTSGTMTYGGQSGSTYNGVNSASFTYNTDSGTQPESVAIIAACGDGSCGSSITWPAGCTQQFITPTGYASGIALALCNQTEGNSYTVNFPSLGLSSTGLAVSDVRFIGGSWGSSSASSGYTYGFNAVNSVTTATVTNTVTDKGSASTTQGWSYYIGSVDTSNSPEKANVFVTDDASTPNLANSIYSGNYYVYTAPTTPTLAGTNSPTVDTNQYILFSAYESGGATPLTYNFLVYNSVTGIQVANMLTASNTFLWQVTGNSGNTLDANVIITDSATTNEIVNSILTSAWTVEPALATPTIAASNTPVVGSNQYELFSAYESGGTTPYTYNFLVYNSVTNIVVANMITTSNTFLWQVTGNAGNTLVANVFVTDSASTNSIANSILTGTITVRSLSAVLLTGNVLGYETGQSVYFAAKVGNGTSPFTYNYIVTNSVTGVQIANALYTNVAPNGNVFAWSIPAATAGNTFQANVIITDSSSIRANSIKTIAIPISRALAATSLTVSNSVAEQGQYETIVDSISGGTTPYTYNVIVTNSVNGNVIASSLQYNSISTSNTLSYKLPVSNNDLGTQNANGNVFDSSGLPSQAAQFANNADANVPNSGSLSLNGNTMTVAGWMNANAYPGGFGFDFAFSSWSGVDDSWIFDIGTSSGKPYVEMHNSGGTAYSFTGTSALNTNQWYQFAVVLNQNVITYYINGSQVGTASFTGSLEPFSSGTCEYAIGGKECSSSNSFGWDGLLSNIQLYNTSLSAAQVNSLYQEGIAGAPSVPNSIVGWWPLNGNANDLSGNANNGVAVNIAYTNTLAAGYNAIPAIQSTNSFSVYPSLAASITPSSNAIYDQGTDIIFTGTASGGTGSYTYNFLVYAGIPCSNTITSSYSGTIPGKTLFNYTLYGGGGGGGSGNGGNGAQVTGSFTISAGNSLTVYAGGAGGGGGYFGGGGGGSGYYGGGGGNNDYVGGGGGGGSSAILSNSVLINYASGGSGGAGSGGSTAGGGSSSGGSGGGSGSNGGSQSGGAGASGSGGGAGGNGGSGGAGGSAGAGGGGYGGGGGSGSGSNTGAGSGGSNGGSSSNGVPGGTTGAGGANSGTEGAGGSGGSVRLAWVQSSSVSNPSCLLSDATSGALVGNYLSASGQGGTLTYAFPVNSANAGNTLFANVSVTDTASTPVTVNSIPSGIFTVNAALTASIAPSSNGQYDQGTDVIFTATAGGGTTSYTYNFLVYNSVTNIQVGNFLSTATTSTTQTYAFPINSANAGNTLVANVFITDGSGNAVAVNSIHSVTIQVVSPIGQPSITPSSAQTYDVGSTVIFNTPFPGGGVGTFTYNFLVYNSITNVLIANQLSTSQTFAYTIPAAGNTLVANVFVTDQSANEVPVNSVHSGVITIDSALNTPTIAPSSNAIYDQGTDIVFTGTASGGTGSYTYNFLVYNSVTHTVVGNYLSASGQGGTLTYAFPVNSANAGNTLVANVFVNDNSANSVSANSIPSGVFTVDAALNTPTITPSSNAMYDQGTDIIFTGTASGGTGSYTYNFLVYNSVTHTKVGNYLSTSGQSGTLTYAFPVNSANAGNTLVANVFVTDSSANAVSANSLPSGVFTVDTSLGTPTITPSSNAIYDQGTDIIFTGTASGGTGSYTYNFLVYNSVTHTKVGNYLTASGQGGSLTYAFPVNSANAGNTLVANVFVTDSSANSASVNSIPSGVFTINSSITVSLTPSSNAVYDQGTSINLTATVSGGTKVYTYNFLVYNSVTHTLVGNFLNVSVGASTQSYLFPVNSANAGNTLVANIFITDTSANAVAVNSIPSGVFTVNSILLTGVLTETNTAIDNGQYARLAGHPSGGSPPYTINYFPQPNCSGTSIGSGTSVLVNPAHSTTYSFNVVDSSGAPSGACSASNTLTVNTVLATPTIAPSNPTIDSGQSFTFNSVWPSNAMLGIDGASNDSFSSASSNSVKLTTYNSSDVVVVLVGFETGSSTAQSVSSISDTAGLTWQKRSAVTQASDINGYYNDLEVWYAIASNPLSNDAITAHLSGTINEGTIIAFGVSGANTTSPWDTNALLPVTTSNSAGPAEIYISTSNANDILLGYVGNDGGSSIPLQSGSRDGWVGIANTNTVKTNGTIFWGSGVGYQLAGSLQSSAELTLQRAESRNTYAENWIGIGDAMRAGVQSGTPKYTATLYSSATSTCNSGSTQVQQITNIGTTNVLFSPVSPTSTTYYCIFVTDSAPVAQTTNSINSKVTVNPALIASVTPSSNTLYDQGTDIIFTGTASGGTSTFTYNFLVYNSVTHTLVGNYLSAAGQGSSLTYAFPVNSANAGNTLVANVFITDSATFPNTVNSVPSGVFTVDTSLNTPTITPSANAVYDQGTDIIFSGTASGGTGSYTYNFLVYNSVTHTVVANYLSTSGQGSSLTYAFPVNSANAGNTLVANVFVTDSSGNTVTVNSLPSGVFTVDTALGTPTIAPSSNAVYDQGTDIIFTGTASGGTGSYTYNFLVYNSVTHTQVGNFLSTSGQGGSVTYAFPVNSANAGNTLVANVFVTDSSANAVSANSLPSGVFTVDTALGTPTIAPSSNAVYDQGTDIIFTGTASGGTGSYTYNFLVYNSVTHTVVGNYLTASGQGGSLTYAFPVNSANAGNTLVANVFVTDAGANAVTVNSVPSGIFTVEAALGTPAISPSSAQSYEVGQTVTFTASGVSGGTTPYTYNFVIYNSITNALIASSGYGSSASYAYTIPATGNTLVANVFVQDSSANVPTTNSILSGVITVYSKLGVPTIAPSSAGTYDVGQTIPFNAYVTGGSGSYSYNFLVYNSVTNIQVGNLLTTSNSFAYSVPSSQAGNTLVANVFVTDTGITVPFTQNSILSGVQTIQSGLTTPTISVTNTLADASQYIIFTGTVSGGTAPYTYNFLVVNTITGALLANLLTTNSLSSNTFAWQIPAADAGNTLNANVIVTDSLSQSANSVKSSTIAVNAFPTTPSLTPSNSVLDSGQYEIFTSSWTGGTYPFTVKIYNITGSSTLNQYTSVQSTSNSYAFKVSSPTSNNNFQYNAIITDGATTGATVNSIANTIVVNPALAPTISASNTVVHAGQYVVFTATTGGGTSPYTYNYQVVNTITGTLIANALYTGVSGTSNTFSWQVPSGLVGNTLEGNVIITDSASSAATSNSVESSTITVVATGAVTLTPSNTLLDDGQYEIFTSSWPSTVGPYTVNYFNVTGSKTLQQFTGVSGTSNAFAFVVHSPTANNAFQYNVIITDSESTPAVSNSVTNTIQVSPALAPTISASNTVVHAGQYVVFTATTGGGTSSYTYNYQVVNTITGTLIANALYTGVSSTTNTFSWQVPVGLVGNTLQANVIITDSASTAATANSVESSTITVVSVSSVTLIPSNVLLDDGQTEVFTSTWAATTGPYTVNYFNVTGSKTLQQFTGVSGTSNAFSFVVHSPTANNAFQYNVIITDSQGVPQTANSITNTIQVSPALAPTIAASNTAVYAGQYVAFTANTGGGTSLFTYNYMVVNTITGTLIANALYTGVSGTSNTFLWQVPSGLVGNTLEANVIVTDSASTPVTANSVYSATITIQTSPTTPTLTPSNTLLDDGQTETFTSSWAATTGPYTVNYFNVTGSKALQLYTGVSSTSNAFSFVVHSPTANNAFQYNVIITDSQGSPQTTNSITNTIEVSPALNPSVGASNTVVQPTQYIAFNGASGGGTSPYTYNYVVVNVLTGTVVANALYTGVSSTSNTFLWQVPSNAVGDRLQANLTVTDSASTAEALTVQSGTMIVLGSGTTVGILVSNTLIDSGQFQVLTGAVVGHTSPFTYNFMVYNSSNTLVANALYASVASSQNAFAFTQQPSWGTGAFTVNLVVTDSSSPANVLNASVVYGANSAISGVTLTPSSSSLTNGQTETFTASWSGGTGTYTVTYFNITGNTILGQYSGVSGTTNAFAFTIVAPTSNSFTYNVFITDSASTKEKLGSGSSTINVGPSTVTPTTTIPSGVHPSTSIKTTSTTTIPKIGSTPQILISSVPIYTWVGLSSRLSSIINLQNIANVTEGINISVAGGTPSNILSIPTNALYITPGSYVGVPLDFMAGENQTPGTYDVPLQVKTTLPNGASAYQTEFLTVTVYNQAGRPTMDSQVSLINATQVGVTVQVSNPTRIPINNLIVQTYLPSGVVSSANSIKTPGANYNVTAQKGYNIVQWDAGSIQPSHSTYAYYVLQKAQNINLLNSMENLLAVESAASANFAQSLRIANPVTPTLYVNSTGVINVSAVYTGTSPQNVSFVLTAPPSIKLTNATQNITILPEQFVNLKFGIQTGQSSGTATLILYVNSNNANLTYYLPVVVSQTSPPAYNATTVPQPVSFNPADYTKYELPAAAVIVAAAAAYLVRWRMRRAKFSKDRLESLKGIKEKLEKPPD
ncbi:MAG: hypothetical protein KGH72_02860 [Candidatus Micrarchaeota archaeon]|nr:hypothetical protein [Candidatus Micrarchaeota archaeon]